VDEEENDFLTGENEPFGPSEENNDYSIKQEKFGLGDLLSTLLDLKTLPHIILLMMLSSTLYAFAQIDSLLYFSAIGFISLSFGYAITATATRWDAIFNLVRVNEISSDSWIKSLIMRSIRSWSVPIIISSIIALIISIISSNNDSIKDWVPFGLASLFLVWSIGQGSSFKSSTYAWISSSTKITDSTAREGTLFGAIIGQLIGVVTFSIIIGYGYSSGFEGDNNFKWFGFVIISILLQIVLIFLHSGKLREITLTRGGATLANRWGLISQIFIIWHIASAWRRLIDDPSPITMILEEFVLMLLTVVLAIWALASRNVSKGGKLFTSDNALFWGLSFGFGYAGSIAMISNITNGIGGNNIATTMAIGHIITALTIIILYPIVINKHSRLISIYADELISESKEDSEQKDEFSQKKNNEHGELDIDEIELIDG
tara:strand:- start:2008 stop:3303 length:1296 start_codon:yes stop_codon:yes gene_type:complete